MTDQQRYVMHQALESPVWIQPDHLQKARQAPFLCRVEPTQRHSDFVALYTAPSRREQEQEPALVGRRPAQCSQLLDTALAQHEPLSVEALARALVAAHLIDAAAIDDPDGYDGGLMLDRVQDLHRRLAGAGASGAGDATGRSDLKSVKQEAST